MPTIQEALDGPVKSLGPVTVTKFFPKKPGDKKSFMYIEDATGKMGISVFGNSANTIVQDRTQITFAAVGQGDIKKNEYNGKISLTAYSCDIMTENAGNRESVRSHTASHSSAPAANAAPRKTADEMAHMMVENSAKVIAYGIEAGLPEEVINGLAINCNQTMALWWTGEKCPIQ